MNRLMLSMMIGVAGNFAPLQDGPTAPPLRRFEYSQIHMGVAVRLTLYAPTEQKAEAAAKAAYARFAELEQVMSDYRPTSEISEVCRRAPYGPVRVSDDLWRVLSKSLEFAKATDGAFDPTVGPLVALWRTARQSGKLPPPEAIAGAKEKVGWRYIELDAEKKTVRITRYGVKIDFGGIAKGDACDQAAMVLRRRGIRSAMIESGGDIVCVGAPPGKDGWTLSILNRPETFPLKDKAISTSGDAEQFVEIEGVRYSHIVDPKTGLGLTNRLQASAIARSGLLSDPLATAFCILGEREGARLARKLGVKVIFVASARN
jgi:thiamine biosynthesis lipoprotein